MSFGQPLALLALLALTPLLGVWAYAAWRRQRADAAYGGPPALRRGLSRRRTRIRTALLLGAIVLAAFAIARPQWGGAESPLTRRGIDVTIALDISRSMGATDVAPSRAAAAASGLDAMFEHLRGDRVGLVTFGGSAFARSPLTLDLDALTFLVNRAQLEGALVDPGTDIGKAIEASLRLLDVPDRAHTQAIVLISDGENLGQNLDTAVEDARQRGVRIYTVAVGTDAGAAVPPRATAGAGQQQSPAQPDTTESGLSHADRATLAHIASVTGGDTREVDGIAGLAVEFTRLQQTNFDQESETVPVERFQWFLGGALVLLLVQWFVAEGRRPTTPLRIHRRRGLGASALLGMLGLAALLAGCGGTAAYGKVRDGNVAYEAGRYEDALTAYRAAKELSPADPIIDYDIGNSLNHLQRYNEAITASRSAAQTADRDSGDSSTYAYATYAVGNHALASNALEDARDAYIDVLLRDPTDADAKHNLELVLRLLDPTQGQQPQATATPDPGSSGTPSVSPDASPQAGDGTAQPGSSPTAPAGGQQGQTPGGSPTAAPGQPGATPPPGGTATAGGTPSAPGQPGDSGGDTESLADQLDKLLADGVSLEDALSILDRLRQESEAAGLQSRGPEGSSAGDR